MKLRSTLLFTALLVLSGATAAAALPGGDRGGTHFSTRSPVIAKNGMAATSHPLATQIAIDVLKKGGSAVDAAIAANAALGLMEPTGNGIGGDLFAIVWDPGARKLAGLNASGRSPLGLSYEQLKSAVGANPTIPIFGPLPVTVPGAVDGWFMLHGRYGKLPMAELLAPTVRYAREGVPVPQIIAGYWQSNLRRFERDEDQIPELANFRKTYLISGKAPAEGEIFRNPDLALTLEAIGKGGRDVFYKGRIAAAIDAYMQRVGGYLRRADLERHTGTWVEPVRVNYRGYDIYELPPNGQGIAALQMLNILEGFDLKTMGHNSADYLHAQVEAKKLAFADRARYYADPDFSKTPVAGLLDKSYAGDRRRLIAMDRAQPRLAAGLPPAADTIYLTTADKDGMMVSLIQSNYVGMGGGLVPDGLGFMLQDRGAQFGLTPGHPNVYAPGKRPFHTIIPAFVMQNGKPFMSFGVMGGDMQPQGHVQILCNIVDFGMDVQQAGDAARYYHTGDNDPDGRVMVDGGTLNLESGVGEDSRTELVRRGHRLAAASPGAYGGYQAIQWDQVNRVYRGASEMRKDGQVSGF
ncbi:MAG: gamma-glutamyltransferase family protein [Aphanocapsa lilacina HA4352-LM1]|jgi:gamma-glutamyltranspeptidase/glutathione hydrolase|nr:gamma-glutamyltransferase family protein [Aphanocapsa lilacina HA4352-LM1]